MRGAPLTHPLALAALVGLLGVATVAALEGGGPATIQASTCWACHSAWTPTLKVPTTVTSVGGERAPVGEPFQPRLLVQNAWRADVRHLSLAIDLTQAPSLAFSASVPPLRQNETVVLRADPAQPTVSVVRETAVNLSSSPSASRIRVVPASSDPNLGPRLVATLSYPDGHRLRAEAPGRGQAIDLPEALTGQVGTVRIAVELPGLQPSAENLTAYSLPVADVAASVEATASFEYASLRKVAVGVPVTIPAGGSAPVAGLNLSVLREPASGERVGFLVNTTVHYAHGATPATGDWANWTQEVAWIPLVAQGGRVGLLSGVPPPPPALLNGPTMTTIAEAVGYTGAFLIVSSIASGGMFGKGSRRGLNTLFGSAKRRVAFHNFLSYGLIAASLAHMALFFAEGNYAWSHGLLWGGGAMLAMLGLGVTGALQVPLIRRWGFAGWRLAHHGMALAVIALTLAHLALEGAHFGEVQDAIGYADPLSPSG